MGNLLFAFGKMASAGSTVLGGIAENDSRSVNEDIAQGRYSFNANYQDQQAENARRAGDLGASQTVQKGRQVIGSQKAAYAGSGVDVNAGTAGIMASDAAVQSELDAMKVKTNAYQQALGYSSEASNTRTDAALSKLKFKSAQRRTVSDTANRAFDYLKEAKF